MKRIWITRIGVSLGAAMAVGAVEAACAHNDATIFIRQVFAPVQPTNGACTYTADITQAAESVGALDVSYPQISDYSPEVLVGNQIISQGNASAIQAETSRVLINGAITRITDLAGNTDFSSTFVGMCSAQDVAACNVALQINPANAVPQLLALCDDEKGVLAACNVGKAFCAGTASAAECAQKPGTLPAQVNPFSTRESTAIEPASASTAAYADIQLTMVDSATVGIFRAYFEGLLAAGTTNAAAFTTTIQILTYTKLEGVTLGGDTVESNEFEFPVTLSFGNLVANLAQCNPPAVVCQPYELNGVLTTPVAGDYCTLVSTSASGATLSTCIPGQDGFLDSNAILDVPVCTVGAATSGVDAATVDAG